MKICRVIIHNFRNIKHVDVNIEDIVAIIGSNNSGKTNFLKALSLPLMLDDGDSTKRLGWYDINKEARDRYYSFIDINRESILNDSVNRERWAEVIPNVSVELEFVADINGHFDIRDLLVEERDGKFIGKIMYNYHVKEPFKLLDRVKTLISGDGNLLESKRMTILPTELFTYEIIIPGKNTKVSYDTLKGFRYSFLTAERDSFSSSSEKIGSRLLVDLFQRKLTPQIQGDVEQEYTKFFESIKNLGDLDNILNWQNYSEIPNAKEFFKQIRIFPNMPSMNSILGSIKLGYGEDNLFSQGLGNRNLILLMVLLNSLLSKEDELSYKLVALEEPEAHLCTSNVLLIASFIERFKNLSTISQLFYSTHNTELINKVGLEHVLIMNGGAAYSLKNELDDVSREYLANNPNTDIFKILFSRRVILVEGITEELLIKSYLQSKNLLNDIKVFAFHKGFKKIIEIWKKVNVNSINKLGVIRDFDDQKAAQEEHEKFQSERIKICTTSEYTLEPETVNAGNNYELLKNKYGDEYGWNDLTKDQLQEKWRKSKTDIMFRICKDLLSGDLNGFTMPAHISGVIDFMIDKKEESAVDDN